MGKILIAEEVSTPATPPSGYIRFYWEGNVMKWIDDTGTVYIVPAQYTDAMVLAVALTGYSVGADVALAASDTILQAFQKLQGQMNARALSSITISAGTGLSGGGDLTANRTISMPNTGTAGTYGSASQVPVLTTDTQGRVTNVVNTAISILASAVTNFASTVLATVLTGLSTATATAVTAADTILVGIGKLQAQLNTILNPATTQASATADTTTTSATDVLMNSMTLTPAAGTYGVVFSTSLESSSNNAIISVSVYAGGVQAAHSERQAEPATSGGLGSSAANMPVSTNAEVTVNGSQAIEIRWRITAGTATAHQRTMNIRRVR